eukprot:3027598-Amphidinium_carterae.1
MPALFHVKKALRAHCAPWPLDYDREATPDWLYAVNSLEPDSGACLSKERTARQDMSMVLKRIVVRELPTCCLFVFGGHSYAQKGFCYALKFSHIKH